MAFQTKDFTSIAASMINWMRSTQRKITDFNIGSVVRTLVEAVAVEIDELYQQFFSGVKEAIPVSVYYSFDFSALSALPASGLVRVQIASSATPVVISAGTSVTYLNGPIAYTVNQDTTVPAGNTFVDLLVTAATPGVAGNVVAGTEFNLQPVPPGFVSASNLSPFVNGRDDESADDRKSRFQAYIQSLNRGTVTALMYGMKTSALYDGSGNVSERVVSSAVVEPYLIDAANPIAWVQCYIHNGVGSTSSALVAKTREVLYGYRDTVGNAIPGWKAAGVKVDVHAATEELVSVSATLTVLAGFDKPTIIVEAEQAIFGYIQGLDIGAPAIKSEIIAIVMSIEGVYNFVVSAPAVDTVAGRSTKLMPGTIVIA